MIKTCYLFSEPSFIEGISRLIDFGSTLNVFNYSPTGIETDYKAIKSDWEIVGNDMRKAVDEYVEKTKQ